MSAPSEDQRSNDFSKGKQKSDGKQRQDAFRGFMILSQMGFTMASCVIVGVLIGRFLDGLMDSSPWGVVFFSLLGLGAAFKSLYDMSLK
ncbi:MAG: AtpZ/AtpI family protein [Symbiobacteriaceae bacterium]|nr:AtpZ/AtpI family protein [Symbiobacteriaceae bacterium]